MPKNNHIQVDCIADVHLSPHIIPPLLPRLRRGGYDLFLTECGAGLEQSESCPSSDDSALQELVHQQKDYAKKWKTLSIGRQVADIIGCEPITIDNPGYWLSAMRELEKLADRFRQSEGSGENNALAGQLWGDVKYRADVVSLIRSLMVSRDSWMVRQVKAITATVSGQRKRPVHALILVGLGHATVLEKALRPWCRFRHLVGVRAARVAINEYLQLLGGGFDGLDKIRTLAGLRHEMIRGELSRWGVPERELADIMGRVAPDSLNARRTECWFHPDGTLAAEIPFRNDQYEGLAKYYDESGVVVTTAQYKNGKLNGLYRYYGKGEILHSEHMYKEGQLNGESRWYSETGSLRAMALYEDGTPHGVKREFYESGQLKSESSFKAGLQDGIGKAYHESGKLKVEFRYRRGKPHGVTRYYDENGQVTSETFYRDGVAIKEAKSKS